MWTELGKNYPNVPYDKYRVVALLDKRGLHKVHEQDARATCKRRRVRIIKKQGSKFAARSSATFFPQLGLIGVRFPPRIR